MKLNKKYFPRLHSLLMKNRYYYKYMHLVWDHCGLRGYINSLETSNSFYKKNYRKV